MPATRFNMIIEQGSDYQLRIPVLDEIGAPVTVDDWVATGQIRGRPGDSPVLHEFDLTVNDQFVDLHVSRAASNDWAFPAAYYDVEIVSPDGSRGTRLIEGLVVVRRQVTRAVDITAPNVPTDLTALPGAAQVTLSWSPSTDDTAVASYRVRRGGAVVATVSGTSYADVGLAVNTTYSYTVSALDMDGNESAQTSPVTAYTSGIVADDFNRADSTTSLGVTSTGAVTWEPLSGTWGISANQGYQPGDDAAGVAVVNVGSANHYAEAKIVTVGSISAVVVRCSAADSRYGLTCTGGSMALYRFSGGQSTLVGSPGSFAAGDTVRLTASGTTLTVRRNGALVGTYTDSVLTTGKPGLHADSAASRFDDFAAGVATA